MEKNRHKQVQLDLLHNFACWAASRAIQVPGVKSGKSLDLKIILEDAGIKRYCKNPYLLRKKKYKTIHNELINKIINNRKRKWPKENCYGLAAKLVAMYMKCAVILPNINCDNLKCTIVKIYPPIDSESLKKLEIKDIKWTKSSKDDYEIIFKVLNSFCEENNLDFIKFESEIKIIKK